MQDTKAMPAQFALLLEGTSDAMARFDEWLDARQTSSRPFRASSVAVYRAMWSTVSRELTLMNCDLRQLTVGRLERMLARVGGSSSYQRRLVALIRDVSGEAENGGHCPATEVLASERSRYTSEQERDRPPVVLNATQQQALIDLLTERAVEGEWQRQRDVAMAAAILGAGLKPGEALRLDMSQVVFGGLDATRGVPIRVTLPGNAATGPRETPIAQWAGQVLHDWFAVRAQFAVPGPLAFPADLRGVTAIAKTTFYRQFAKILDELGIKTRKQGGHLLRHTFAVRQLERGVQMGVVRDWLGLELPESGDRYRRVVGRTAAA